LGKRGKASFLLTAEDLGGREGGRVRWVFCSGGESLLGKGDERSVLLAAEDLEKEGGREGGREEGVGVLFWGEESPWERETRLSSCSQQRIWEGGREGGRGGHMR